ncbi:hypothetical protein [Thiohalophilus sp.]|uniref:hypothetical protein n=1 Tax=Thiohalophilus sp. TaxID=3028392 RepID=UPI002ACF06DA|nr:hypothetical protein [Thiohalophilus sp.]MDZ7803681.1 hypothetical protein [Thiohalophilus sp.]
MLLNSYLNAGLLSVAASLLLVAPPLLASEHEPGYLPQFRLNLDDDTRRVLQLRDDSESHQALLQPRLHNVDSLAASSGTTNRLQQYDARLFYPVNTAHGMSLDLGLNIKYLDAVGRYPQAEGPVSVHNFNQAIPMFYATALFELPFDGLSASLEGSHRDSERARAFDYQAKLQYKWHRGLGLEGGWRHQQYSLDNGQTTPGLEYESRGVFLDLFMDF